MIFYILISILCVCLGILAIYQFIFNKRANNLKINIKQYEDIKNLLQADNLKLKEENKSLQNNKNNLKQEIDIINNNINQLNERKKESQNSLQEQKKLIQQLLTEKTDTLNIQFEQAAEKASTQYQEAIADFQKEYEQILNDTVNNYNIQFKNNFDKLENLNKEIKEAEKTQAIIIEQFKEKQKEKDQIDFYKIQISQEDIEEIRQLKNIIPHLRNKEPLMKVIWEVYYKKPFSDLIGRLLGQNSICGIYKITNINNNMSYIGQSVDIKSRFRSHVRKGLGVEAYNNNKLYSAMNSEGVENFTFKILEECPREELNKKEKYWISFFKTTEFGYNETKGNTI